MQTTLHRARQLAAKVVRRFRRVAANFSQPSDVERLMAALPAVETSDGIKGQVVLITGSTRGVGKVIAETLAKDGARIIIHGRDGTQAQMVAQALPDTGAGPHLALAADLGTKGGAADMIAQALKLAGRIDVLIHNAAQMGPGDKFAWEIAPDHFDQVMRTNFGAVHEASSSLITHWLEAGQVGRILHISTGAAAQPSAKISGYGVSKAALESLAAHFTADLASSGIAITTVRLGSVKTDMTAAYFSWEDAEQLPPPESVMPVIQHAVTAPADSVHGRVFTSWGFNADAVSAKAMTHPAAAAPMFRYPQFEVDGEKVTRDSGRLTIYDRAENQFGPAPEVTAALQDLLQNRPLSIYPDDDYYQLRNALAAHHDLPASCFTTGAGSWDVLDRTLKLYTKPGDTVVVNDPGWFGFTMLTQRRQVGQIRVPFQPGGGGNRAHHNLDGVLSSIAHNTRLIYLINPSNPEGVSLDRDEFMSFLAQVPSHIPVIVDEAYAEFATTPSRLNGPDLIRETDHPIIVTRTFSKFYALAALRIGYGIASPEIIERLDRVSLIFSVSKLAETAAIAALGATDWNAQLLAETESERQRIFDAVQSLGHTPIKSDGCAMLVPAPCELEKFFDTYSQHGIEMPRAAFFDGKYVFFPVARPEQNDRNLEIFRSLC